MNDLFLYTTDDGRSQIKLRADASKRVRFRLFSGKLLMAEIDGSDFNDSGKPSPKWAWRSV